MIRLRMLGLRLLLSTKVKLCILALFFVTFKFPGRNQAGVCALRGKVVAVGGCDAWNCLNSMEIYDPETNLWIMGPPMTATRRGCGVAVFKGKLYVVGGSDGTHSLVTTEIYDWDEQTWAPGPNMATPRANVGVAVVGNRLYAVGGFSGKQIHVTAFHFKPIFISPQGKYF